MKIKAYPKINLCLKVDKQKKDGKHTIDSIFYLWTKIYDVITIQKSISSSVYYKENGSLFSLPDCLVTKSLKYLSAKYGVDVNYKITILKRIPFASGLGGGSADAAAVINYILKLNKNIRLDLKEIAVVLGSDIPFFLSQYKVARVRGLGERVSPILQINPNIDVQIHNIPSSTAKVFRLLDMDEKYESKVNVDNIIDSFLYKQHLNNVVYNDLTKYIIENCRELEVLLNASKGKSFFTGSGSTIIILKD